MNNYSFILQDKVLWVSKSEKGYGFGFSKKSSESQFKPSYANVDIPNFVCPMGNYSPSNKQENLLNFPAMEKYIEHFLPFEIKKNAAFLMVYSPEQNASCLIVMNLADAKKDLMYIWNDQGSVFDQLQNCIYQFYIEVINSNWQNGSERQLKLVPLVINWYNRIPKKRLK